MKLLHAPWKLVIVSFVSVFLIAGTVQSQSQLTGMMADSATMQPLPNVNIRIKNGGPITVSDIRGFFSLTASDEDTVVFSIVGYYSKSLPVKLVREVAIIFMTEEQKTLESVEIRGDVLLPYLKKIPQESPWKNPTYSKGFTETPGFQGIQTFGPGYTLKGPISRFSKYEKERKKLKKVQQQNYNAQGYVELVNSPEVKDRIMKDYNISEEEYFRLLAVFNEKNKDIIYELEPNELIAILLMFYGENTKKK